MAGLPTTRSKPQLGVGALSIAFVFLAWCVLLVGLAAVQHRANDRNFLEFEWWIVAFDFLLVALAAMELLGFRRGHSGLVALKAVNTALIMLYAQNWNNNRRNPAYAAYGEGAVRTVFAGFVLLAIANATMILALGTEPPSHAEAAYMKGREQRAVPVGTAAGAGSLAGGNGQTVV